MSEIRKLVETVQAANIDKHQELVDLWPELAESVAGVIEGMTDQDAPGGWWPKPADDPSKDPVGTVRTDGYSTAVKSGNYDHSLPGKAGSEIGWVLLANGAHEYALRLDSQVTGWEIIGAVPGTPAAEAQKPREPWTGDGSEEPPAHVTKVRDALGDFARRKGSQWIWYVVSGEDIVEHAPLWDWDGNPNLRYAPYTEVLPE